MFKTVDLGNMAGKRSIGGHGESRISSYHYDVDDNYIMEYYRTKPAQFKFIIKCALQAATSPRANLVYTRYPIEFAQLLLDGSTIDKAIARLNISVDEIELVLKTADVTEKVIYIKYGEYVYMFIKYSLLNCKQYIVPVQYVISLLEQSTDSELLRMQMDIKQFKMYHTREKEEHLRGKATEYVFHGSPLENWHNILQNGLKIPIGGDSKLSRFHDYGAYGMGIYISPHAQTSLGYSMSGDVNMIVAVCEVVSAALKRHCATEYTVTDESVILIRYILCIPMALMLNNKLYEKNNKLYEKMCRSIVPNINYVKHNTRLTKRLEVEMGNCVVASEFIVEQKGENKKQWIMHFSISDCMDAPTLLIRQLREKNIESVDVEFTFSARYPYKPPFMRVIYPRIIVAKESIAEDDIYSGIDDNGGGICTGLFNSSGEWSPVTSMLNVGVYIRSLLFCSPHLQLHPSRWMEPYSEMDALREYSDVLSTFTLEDAVELM